MRGIRRLASKVTISFDTTNLYENIYIHIKSAQIHNIPRTCTLLDPNDETRIAAPTKTFGSTAIRSNTERAATSTCGRA